MVTSLPYREVAIEHDSMPLIKVLLSLLHGAQELSKGNDAITKCSTATIVLREFWGEFEATLVVTSPGFY